jgi:hypothetical protein
VRFIDPASYLKDLFGLRRRSFLHSWDYFFAINCLHTGPPEAKPEGSPSEKLVDKQSEQKHTDIIALIETRLERLGASKEYALEREQLTVDAEGRSFSLPSADATAKLLRYEAYLDRQVYRAP